MSSLSTYFVVGDEEYVEFNESMGSHDFVKHVWDMANTPLKPGETDKHHLHLTKARISPGPPPHRIEFPTVIRVKGNKYKPSGRWFSWDDLARLNPMAVKPPPSLDKFRDSGYGKGDVDGVGSKGGNGRRKSSTEVADDDGWIRSVEPSMHAGKDALSSLTKPPEKKASKDAASDKNNVSGKAKEQGKPNGRDDSPRHLTVKSTPAPASVSRPASVSNGSIPYPPSSPTRSLPQSYSAYTSPASSPQKQHSAAHPLAPPSPAANVTPSIVSVPNTPETKKHGNVTPGSSPAGSQIDALLERLRSARGGLALNRGEKDAMVKAMKEKEKTGLLELMEGEGAVDKVEKLLMDMKAEADTKGETKPEQLKSPTRRSAPALATSSLSNDSPSDTKMSAVKKGDESNDVAGADPTTPVGRKRRSKRGQRKSSVDAVSSSPSGPALTPQTSSKDVDHVVANVNAVCKQPECVGIGVAMSRETNGPSSAAAPKSTRPVIHTTAPSVDLSTPSSLQPATSNGISLSPNTLFPTLPSPLHASSPDATQGQKVSSPDAQTGKSSKGPSAPSRRASLKAGGKAEKYIDWADDVEGNFDDELPDLGDWGQAGANGVTADRKGSLGMARSRSVSPVPDNAPEGRAGEPILASWNGSTRQPNGSNGSAKHKRSPSSEKEGSDTGSGKVKESKSAKRNRKAREKKEREAAEKEKKANGNGDAGVGAELKIKGQAVNLEQDNLAKKGGRKQHETRTEMTESSSTPSNKTSTPATSSISKADSSNGTGSGIDAVRASTTSSLSEKVTSTLDSRHAPRNRNVQTRSAAPSAAPDVVLRARSGEGSSTLDSRHAPKPNNAAAPTPTVQEDKASTAGKTSSAPAAAASSSPLAKAPVLPGSPPSAGPGAGRGKPFSLRDLPFHPANLAARGAAPFSTGRGIHAAGRGTSQYHAGTSYPAAPGAPGVAIPPTAPRAMREASGGARPMARGASFGAHAPGWQQRATGRHDLPPHLSSTSAAASVASTPRTVPDHSSPSSLSSTPAPPRERLRPRLAYDPAISRLAKGLVALPGPGRREERKGVEASQ